MTLSQEERHVSEYALEFRTIAAGSGWNSTALKAAFRKGLNSDVLTELDCRDEQLTLDALIDLAIPLDLLLLNRPTSNVQVTYPSPIMSVEPIQLGRARLSETEQERRRRENCCFYCGQTGHHIWQCSLRPSIPPATSRTKFLALNR